MCEAKFTKGEWFIEKGANWNDDRWAISVKRDYDDSIHHCFAEVVYKMEHEYSNPELEANAHLIAAAPEMYDYLDGLHQSINLNGGVLTIDEDDCEYIGKLLAKARGVHV